MNNDIKKIFKNALIASYTLLIISCTIDDGDNDPVEYTPKLGTANIVVMNLLTDIEEDDINTVDIYVDETKILSEAHFGEFTDGYLAYKYPQGTLVRAVYGGENPVYVTNPVEQIHNIITYATASEMLPEDHNTPLQGQLKEGGHYTLALVGNYHNIAVYTFVMQEDDLSAPSAGTSKIRFANGSIENCAFFTCDVDFIVNGEVLGTSGYPGNSQEDHPFFTDFVETEETSFTLEVWTRYTEDQLAGDPLADPPVEPAVPEIIFSEDIDITTGGIYTVMFMGDSFTGTSGEETQIKVFKNK